MNSSRRSACGKSTSLSSCVHGFTASSSTCARTPRPPESATSSATRAARGSHSSSSKRVSASYRLTLPLTRKGSTRETRTIWRSVKTLKASVPAKAKGESSYTGASLMCLYASKHFPLGSCCRRLASCNVYTTCWMFSPHQTAAVRFL